MLFALLTVWWATSEPYQSILAAGEHDRPLVGGSCASAGAEHCFVAYFLNNEHAISRLRLG